MTNTPPPPDPRTDATHEWLSALADGERDAVGPGCEAWRADAAARERWHAYHLIGDVLRSDELASTPERDAAFLTRLRGRLALEPVPLAPAPIDGAAAAAAAAKPARQRWMVPAGAVAAGLVAVIGVSTLLRTPATLVPEAGPLAQQRVPDEAQRAAPGVPQRLVVTGGQIRDPELDAYLRAHHAARGPVPAALPGGALRQVEMVVVPLAAAGGASSQAGVSGASGAAR